MRSFTGIRDVDKIILNNLNTDDLMNVCQIQNVYLDRLCNEIFQQRVSIEFPRSINNKPNNMNWSEFYKLLIEGEKEYQNIISLANEFKNVAPNSFLVFPAGNSINRKDIRRFLNLWINKYRNIMNDDMIKNAQVEIETSMT